EKLRIPLGQAKFPWHFCAAELALTFVPSAVHRPVPSKGRAVLASERRFHPVAGPVLEPVGQLLNRSEVRIEVDAVHRAEIARRVMINDPAWVQPFHDGFRTR